MVNKYKNKLSIIMVVIILIFTACYESNPVVTEFNKTFGSNFKESDLQFELLYDNYSGAPYEGQKFYKITVLNNSVLTNLSWSEMPLSNDLVSFLYHSSYKPSIAETVGIPNINDGYWCYVNRGKHDIAEGLSYNFSLAIVDITNNIIYYYKIDT